MGAVMQSEAIDKIEAARQAVMKSVASVPKRSKNDHANYQYAGEADIIQAVRPHMVEHGLALRPVAVRRESAPAKTSTGKTVQRTDVEVTYRLSHVSGQWIDLVVIGSDSDSQGKDAAQAMTDARKIALLECFTLAKVDERAHREQQRKAESPPANTEPPRRNEPAKTDDSVMRFFADVAREFKIQSQDLVWYLDSKNLGHPKTFNGDKLTKTFEWLKGPGADKVREALASRAA